VSIKTYFFFLCKSAGHGILTFLVCLFVFPILQLSNVKYIGKIAHQSILTFQFNSGLKKSGLGSLRKNRKVWNYF